MFTSPRARRRTVAGFGAWIVAGSTALGVGFPVSFSTAVALYLRQVELPLLSHLNLVNALALLLAFGLAAGIYLRRMAALAREGSPG